jgi:hypothetical protein
VLLEGQIPLVVKVIVYVLIALALRSINPVEVFRNTSPAGVALKVPVAPPVMFATGSALDWQNAEGE